MFHTPGLFLVCKDILLVSPRYLLEQCSVLGFAPQPCHQLFDLCQGLSLRLPSTILLSLAKMCVRMLMSPGLSATCMISPALAEQPCGCHHYKYHTESPRVPPLCSCFPAECRSSIRRRLCTPPLTAAVDLRVVQKVQFTEEA